MGGNGFNFWEENQVSVLTEIEFTGIQSWDIEESDRWLEQYFSLNEFIREEPEVGEILYKPKIEIVREGEVLKKSEGLLGESCVFVEGFHLHQRLLESDVD